MMKRVIPKVFYDRMDDGIELSVNGLSSKLMHGDDTLTVVERDGVKAYVVEDAEFAAKDRPERIDRDGYDRCAVRRDRRRKLMLLRPNLKVVTRQPWGA